MTKEKVLLVVSTYGLSLPHIGIVNEIIKTKFQSHSNKILLKCDGQLTSCYLNPTHNIFGCALCIARTNDIIENTFSFQKIFRINRSYNSHKIKFERIITTDDLKKIKYKDIDIGRGIMSSVVSRTRNHNIDFHKFKSHLNHLYSQSCALVEQVSEIVKNYKVTDVLIFNGRFYETYPIMSYCKSKGVNFYTHEKGTTYNKYQLIKNNTVHSINYRKYEIEKIWTEYGSNAQKIAEKWFEEKAKGASTTEINFVEEQEINKLPKIWDREKMNIAIFNSSEDEYKSILEWEHDLYKTQNELIIRLCKSALHLENIRFYVRFHPNLKGIASDQILELKSQNFDNLIIIPPESPISTYALMKESNKILTFGSRTSIEGAYLGTPSILYGRSFFQTLDSLYVPNDYDELLKYIITKDLEPKKGVDLLKAALFLKEKGILMKLNKVLNKNKILINEQPYSTNYLKLLIAFFKMIKDYKHWKKYFKIYNNKKLTIFNIKDL